MPPNLPRALRKGAVSSGTFVLAPFLTICFFFYKLHRISTKLGQNHQWVKGYKSYQQFDLKGQIGVTGVKNVKKSCFYGNATPPTCYIAGSRDSGILTSLRPFTKLIDSNLDFGSFGVTGVKSSFLLKMLLLIQYTLYGHVPYAYKQAWDHLQNSLTQISIWGHLWSHGSKGYFH